MTRLSSDLIGEASNWEDMAEDGEMTSLVDIRESLALAESLAKASLLTSTGAKQRLAARRLEMEDGNAGGGYVPPKHLLLYLVR